jgi:hypothetical protein
MPLANALRSPPGQARGLTVPVSHAAAAALALVTQQTTRAALARLLALWPVHEV